MTRRRVPLERLRATKAPVVVWRGRAATGVEVLVAPMPGFRGVHAALAVGFGSRDTRLPDGRAIPPGVAHFLEHEMFQKSEGDLFDVFEARGAWANAYTTAQCTAFLFDAVGDVEQNLDTLLGGVEALEVDRADVRRERAIIHQELATVAEDASWRGYFELLRGLYHHHPIRHDVAGTPEALDRIDRSLLRAAHDAWYGPGNQVLVVAGAVDPARILPRVERRAGRGPQGAGRPPRRVRDEPPEVLRPEGRLRLGVSRPTVFLGWKERPAKRLEDRVRRQVSTAMVLDLLFGDGGRLETELYRLGLVDDQLSATYEAGEDYAHAYVTAEVDDPDRVRAALGAGMRSAAADGFGVRELERARRRAVGRYLRVFNAPETVVDWLLQAALEGHGLDRRWAALRGLTAGGVTRRLRRLLSWPAAWVLVEPRG